MRTRIAMLAAIVILLGLLVVRAFLPRYMIEGDGVRDRWTQEYCPLTQAAVEVLRDYPKEANAAMCPSGKDLVTLGDGRWFAVD